MSHHSKVCQFGIQHSTCRCPAKDKEIIRIECNLPAVHGPKKEKSTGPDTLHERFTDTISTTLWWMKKDHVAKLADQLEEDVKQWLIKGLA